MSAVAVYSYTQSVTYVADNILKSLKDIIRMSGLDPAMLMGEWDVLLRGLSKWIESRHLERVTLEIFERGTEKLAHRWDIEVAYAWAADAGSFWTDTDQLKFAIKKAGIAPSQAEYRVIVHNKDGRPDVTGWSPTSYLSTDGMVRQSLGTTIEHNGLGANTSYWRKV